MISKLSAKYQLCAIHTAETIDGKVHRIRESTSFIPARSIGYSVLTGGVVNRVRGIYVLPAGVVRCQSSMGAFFFRGTHKVRDDLQLSHFVG